MLKQSTVAKLRTWVEVQPNTPLQRPEMYLDREGNFYCQIRSESGDTYMDIPAPTLEIEGRVPDADS